jgi:hypothetical protein
MSWDNLCYQVLLENWNCRVMIFIFREDGYEIKTDIDGSILTIADAPWPGRLIY